MFYLLIALARSDYIYYGVNNSLLNNFTCNAEKYNNTWDYLFTRAIEFQYFIDSGEIIDADPVYFRNDLDNYYKNKQSITPYESANCTNMTTLQDVQCIATYVNDKHPRVMLRNVTSDLYISNVETKTIDFNEGNVTEYFNGTRVNLPLASVDDNNNKLLLFIYLFESSINKYLYYMNKYTNLCSYGVDAVSDLEPMINSITLYSFTVSHVPTESSSSNNKLAIGLGVGIGVPVGLCLIGGIVYLIITKVQCKKEQENDQAEP